MSNDSSQELQKRQHKTKLWRVRTLNRDLKKKKKNRVHKNYLELFVLLTLSNSLGTDLDSVSF